MTAGFIGSRLLTSSGDAGTVINQSGSNASIANAGGFWNLREIANRPWPSVPPDVVLTIALISDGSSGYSANVTFSLTTLPAGTTQLRYTISGTGATSSVVTISNLNSSSTVSGTGDFRCRYFISSNQGSFFHGPGDDVTNISLTVAALDATNTTLATSNTLTGMEIDEDG